MILMCDSSVVWHDPRMYDTLISEHMDPMSSEQPFRNVCFEAKLLINIE